MKHPVMVIFALQHGNFPYTKKKKPSNQMEEGECHDRPGKKTASADLTNYWIHPDANDSLMILTNIQRRSTRKCCLA
jgi:hypothetical protein